MNVSEFDLFLMEEALEKLLQDVPDDRSDKIKDIRRLLANIERIHLEIRERDLREWEDSERPLVRR